MPAFYVAPDDCRMHYICSDTGDAMANSKTATLTFRIDPSLKEALRVAAQTEHRSIANMVEVLIRGYCEQRGIVIPDSETESKIGGRS
jgi:hypothetical protein